MPDWQTGFTGGVSATIVGFVFTMIWDGYKYRRDILRKKDSIIKGLIHELYENSNLGVENREILKQDMESLKNNKTLIRPLLNMTAGFQAYLKFNIPNKLLNDVDLLDGLKHLALLVDHINEQIRSGQNCKDTSGAMSNFNKSIEIKNNVIDLDIERFNKGVDDVLSKLEAI